MKPSAAILEKMVLDFRKPTSLVKGWTCINDDVMGGESVGCWRLTDQFGVFCGRISLDNNGGFASVHSRPSKIDLGGYDGWVIHLRGDGRRYKFTTRMAQNHEHALYQVSFATRSGVWEEHFLAFSTFQPTSRGRLLTGEPPLDPAQLRSFGFLISERQAGPFQLDVRWIKALRRGTHGRHPTL